MYHDPLQCYTGTKADGYMRMNLTIRYQYCLKYVNYKITTFLLKNLNHWYCSSPLSIARNHIRSPEVIIQAHLQRPAGIRYPLGYTSNIFNVYLLVENIKTIRHKDYKWESNDL